MRDTLIVFGAFTMLMTVSSVIHRSVFESADQSYQNDARQIALTAAQQLLEKVAAAEFDEQTVGTLVTTDSALTPATLLGPELGELVPDDVDDYNNYTIAGDSTRYPGFSLQVQVAYADTSDPLSDSSVQTHLKRITVTVENENYLSSPIVLSTIVAYY